MFNVITRFNVVLERSDQELGTKLKQDLSIETNIDRFGDQNFEARKKAWTNIRLFVDFGQKIDFAIKR